MTEPLMKYFVLKPRGTDRYAVASRAAMRAYAGVINDENRELARALARWANKEEDASHRAKEAKHAD